MTDADEPGILSKYQMVEKRYAEQVARRAEPCRRVDVGLARRQIARRMVVRNDDLRCTGFERFAEHLCGIDHRRPAFVSERGAEGLCPSPSGDMFAAANGTLPLTQ